PVGLGQHDFVEIGNRNDADEEHDDVLQAAEAVDLDGEDQKDPDGGEEGAGEQRKMKKQKEAERSSQEFRNIGCHGGDFSHQPQSDHRGTRKTLAAQLRQRLSGGNSELGGKELHQHGDQVGPQQHPEQQVPELSTALDVGGEIAGIDVGNAGDEGRAEVEPNLVAAPAAAGIGGRFGNAGRIHRPVYPTAAWEFREAPSARG